MSKFDLVVFGATGFTGKRVVKYLKDRKVKYSVAIAGRSEDKLKSLQQELGVTYTIVIADAGDDKSLYSMAKSARVVLNCTGPFRFYGEAVVKACVESKCHYTDITGEPQFIEGTYEKYDDLAKKNGVTIIPACGFDSMPAELGVMTAKSEYKKAGGIVHDIEMFISSKSGPAGAAGNFTTFESAVYGVSDVQKLRDIRKSSRRPRLNTVGKLKIQKLPKNDPRVGWIVIFPGADPSVVKLSQQIQQMRSKDYVAANFAAYVVVPNFLALIGLLFGAMIFGLLANFSSGRNLLLKYPEFFTFGFFSKKGPTEEQIQGTSFSETFYCKGMVGNGMKEVVIKVSGPEPGYH
eukprot:NODE_233_length_13658_cov_0.453647.p3 type:complete len:349 gc:universal NODE_233_length_13658_cov_0.453647:11492-12538(+)